MADKWRDTKRGYWLRGEYTIATYRVRDRLIYGASRYKESLGYRLSLAGAKRLCDG